MRLKEPYFMQKKEWFYFDEDEFCYKLTDKATIEAKKSYDEFYKTLDSKIDYEEPPTIKG